ncbi:hypothetical protein F5X99DRAFT_402332 [Biscogniauxia marginata]|nr:hypothetical protein F5X99DRAFT_402332 [Biscogniauxia marginata]
MVGSTSKMLNDSDEPVHIIMERVSSKTMDAFVEFTSFQDAIQVVEKFQQRNANNGRIGRIGTRHVEVEVSSQTQLMKALFPIARGVIWGGTRPQIQRGSQFPWENFKSFFTEEEISMLWKHVDCPQRSSYARDCPERPYECMISTLKKIPWYMAEYITISQRYVVYDACYKMIGTLQNTISRFPNHERMTVQLFNRLVRAAMLCPGFTVLQKDNIALLAKLPDDGRQFNQPRFADLWRHLYTLGPKPDIPLDVLEVTTFSPCAVSSVLVYLTKIKTSSLQYYIAIIREETTRTVDSLNIGQKIAFQNRADSTDRYFGYLWAEIDFPVGPTFDNMTLAEINQRELQAIDRILRRAIDGGLIPQAYTKSNINDFSLI